MDNWREYTIELVFVPSSASQLRTLDLMSGQEHVQQKTQHIIAQYPQSDLCIIKRRDSSFRPANFLFQRIEGQGGWVK